jgi:hypothetical protein
MPLLSFTDKEFATLSDALEIAEDVTANFFKFSTDQWRRHRYEVSVSGHQADHEEMDVFAFLRKGFLIGQGWMLGEKLKDYYLICLQDHRILSAAQRDGNISLLPLLLYIFTHELIHIVRFCSFFKHFDVGSWERDREEALVHDLTYRALAGISMPSLGYVLELYRGHRVCGSVAP